ncbi:MAG: glutathione S-transferase [Burkholderiales bacterium]|nr:glutathione S-transferase [Burkholderiales bacterium]
MIRLHRFALSGHAHRAQLMLSLLDLPHEIVEIDLMKGEQKSAAYLAINPFGEVPAIEDGDFKLGDSNAILVYLALRYDADRRWLPADPMTQAEIQRWLGVAAGPLRLGAARARWNRISGQGDGSAFHDVGRQMLERVDHHLNGREWLVGDAPTIADIAMYSYTAHAPEGGLSLADHPHIRAWLARVEALPRFVGMQRSAVPA